jgi:light-regulated signal transduction histidine kinase (bacteriophytochrome)
MEYDGQPGSVMVIAHDITERKLAEVEIHQSQQELQMYAERLKRSNQALEDFAFAASHDLKEPLRKVQSFGEILKTSYAHLLDEKGRDYINRMQAATNRMQNMIDGLLEYSRIGMDTQPMTPVDLQEVASEVVSDLETKIEETGGQVVFDSLPTLEADPLQMRMLLQNLLANGLKFHRPDVPPLVKVSAVSYASGWVELVFEDNGVGFKMERVEELFQPFRRLHGRSEFEGSGVGLAICQKIAERHGGAITARSAPGEGSTFIVKLPIRQ